MSKRAKVGHDDIVRALKACKLAGYKKARVHINVAAGTIDIMLGEDATPTSSAHNPSDDEIELL